MTGLERISGPLRSYWIAAYTVAADGKFVGYAKICLERPVTVWEDNFAFRKVTWEGSSHEAALEGVEAAARASIADSCSPDRY